MGKGEVLRLEPEAVFNDFGDFGFGLGDLRIEAKEDFWIDGRGSISFRIFWILALSSSASMAKGLEVSYTWSSVSTLPEPSDSFLGQSSN